jgi:hypothetical protein
MGKDNKYCIVDAGWRSCIDHIITPTSPCPVCKIVELEAENRALRNLIDSVVETDKPDWQYDYKAIKSAAAE